MAHGGVAALGDQPTHAKPFVAALVADFARRRASATGLSSRPKSATVRVNLITGGDRMSELTCFEQECLLRGWDKPADFLRAFHAAAAVLGEDVTLTHRQFSRWRSPSPPGPRARAWRTLHAMFGISPSEMGFPGPPASVTVGKALPAKRGMSAVERRAFLADSLGAAASVGLPGVAQPMSPPGRKGAVGVTHVLELRAGLRSLIQLDDAYGSGGVLPLAVRQLSRVRRIINTGTYADAIGQQLHLLAGEIASQCGWLYIDAGDPENAKRYLGEALTTATMLGDVNLEVEVFATMSLQAWRDHARDALDLARAAQQRATRLGSTVLQSLIASREARALVGMGDFKAAERRLADAMRYLERGERGRPAPAWTAFYGPSELSLVQARLYSESGRHQAATGFHRATLAQRSTNYSRNYVLDVVDLAQNLIDAGEVDEGAAHVTTALANVEEIDSGRVTGRLVKIADALRTVDTASAREATDALTEYAQTKRAA